MVERLFLVVPRGCLQFVIVVFPDHTHLLFFYNVAHIIEAQRSHIDMIYICHYHTIKGYPSLHSWPILQLFVQINLKDDYDGLFQEYPLFR